jgi:hypothetical protein
LCNKLKTTSKDCFWVQLNSVGKYLVPSEVLAEPGLYYDDRRFLSELSRGQADFLMKDGQSVYPNASSATIPVSVTWSTPDGKRPSITTKKIKSVKSAVFKSDEGDRQADYPKEGRAQPFAEFPNGTPEARSQDLRFTPSNSIRAEHSSPNMPSAKSRPQLLPRNMSTKPSLYSRHSISSDLDDELASSEAHPEEESDDETSAPADPTQSNEFRLIRQVQSLKTRAWLCSPTAPSALHSRPTQGDPDSDNGLFDVLLIEFPPLYPPKLGNIALVNLLGTSSHGGCGTRDCLWRTHVARE